MDLGAEDRHIEPGLKKLRRVLMKAIIVPVTPFQQNCSVIWCEKTNKAAVIDPGGDLEHILEVVEKTILRWKNPDHPWSYRSCRRHGGPEGKAERTDRRSAPR